MKQKIILIRMEENNDLLRINGFNYMGLKKYKEELENQILDQEIMDQAGL